MSVRQRRSRGAGRARAANQRRGGPLMCATCGCEESVGEHDLSHDHHHLLAPPVRARAVVLEEDVLAKNDRLAAENRALFERQRIAAFNFTSSPGSGKTSLLEALIRRISDRVPLTVIEGDQETE